jgi:hypothetical protein
MVKKRRKTAVRRSSPSGERSAGGAPIARRGHVVKGVRMVLEPCSRRRREGEKKGRWQRRGGPFIETRRGAKEGGSRSKRCHTAGRGQGPAVVVGRQRPEAGGTP